MVYDNGGTGIMLHKSSDDSVVQGRIPFAFTAQFLLNYTLFQYLHLNSEDMKDTSLLYMLV